MKLTLSLILSIVCIQLQAATSFTEFYCNFSTGANTNAGSSTGAAAYSSVNGNWDGTSVFIPTDGSNPSGTVNVGDWASIYLDAATVSAYVARVTAVTNAVNGGIVLDTSAKAGTAPGSAGTGNSITVGGVWKGPNAAVAFPFNFATSTLTNSSGDKPRMNFKNTATYDITTAMTHSLAGPIRFQGYTTNPGDLGKATIDCATAGAGISNLTISGANVTFADFIISNSGATSGSTDGLTVTGVECCIVRTVVHDVRRNGINISGIGTLIECESYLCNKSNTASSAGMVGNSGAAVIMIRCISHDNAGSNGHGFAAPGSCVFIGCIADSNGGNGFLISNNALGEMNSCDAYNNGGSGVDFSSVNAMLSVVDSCNFVKNAAYGINSSGSLVLRNGTITNCGFGSGTMTNASGGIVAGMSVNIIGSVTYAADTAPWVDAANGDFRINLAAAKGAGRGSFTQTQASYTGAVGYPDIGAAQHLSTAGGGSFTFGQ